MTTELEGGLDVGFLDNRLNIEATYFSKKSRDALFNNPLPPSVGTAQTGAPTQWQNLAGVRNAGFELAIDAQLVRAKLLSWNLRVNGSTLADKLIDAGSAQLAVTQGSRNVVGLPAVRPVGSAHQELRRRRRQRRAHRARDRRRRHGGVQGLHAADARGGGLSNTFGFFGDKLRVVTVFDYRGGFYNQWGFENQRCISGNCREVKRKSTPLPDQAAAVATSSALLGNTVWGFFVPNDFVRFRELSVTATVPTATCARRAS